MSSNPVIFVVLTTGLRLRLNPLPPVHYRQSDMTLSMLISGRRVKASRALLGWSQEHLCGISGVSHSALRSFERNESRPRTRTVRVLAAALKAAGVEFLGAGGVRLRSGSVRTFDGPGAARQLMKDVFTTLGPTGGELVIAFVDEREAERKIRADFLERQFALRRIAKIEHRLLVHTSETLLVPPYEQYRLVSSKYFTGHPFVIYGSKRAMMSFFPHERVIVIDDVHYASRCRGFFNLVWEHSEAPAIC